MASDRRSLSWSSPENHVLLNPRWSADDRVVLEKAANDVLSRYAVEPSLVLTSSGTSAGSWRELKMILLSKRAVLAGASAVARRFSFAKADRLGDLLPGFHVGGLSVSARAHISGAEKVDLLKDEAWSPEKLVRQASAERVSVLSLVPTQLHDLVQLNLTPWPELRVLFLGGAALSPSLEGAARERSWPVVATYGMTETSAMIAVRAEAEPSLGFELLPGVEASIVNERLHLRSPSLATGWARIDSSGGLDWTAIGDELATEDRAERRGARLLVLGRGSDQVKINGENVNLSALRAVAEEIATRLKIPRAAWHLSARVDARSGHVIVLYGAGGVPLADLKSEFDAKALPFERIRAMIEVDEIPRTELGKVREELLRKG